jgi:predicted nuclease of restriction endonuclease-like (RecB) superfamily
VRTLRHKIDHLLFERTAVAKKPEKLIEQDLAALRDEDRLTPDLVFRDPYLLEFLGLTGSYSEKDVERAILRELEAFILELGTDFAFIARQKRMTVDDVDYCCRSTPERLSSCSATCSGWATQPKRFGTFRSWRA